MENYRGTFFRQAMFAEFQLAINDLANKGEALSGEKMSALYFDLLKRYHGPKVMIYTDGSTASFRRRSRAFWVVAK